MANTVCTEHRDALRTRVARAALIACGGAYGFFILVVVGALSNNLDHFDALLGPAVILALATPVLAAIGSFWGLGPCRIACTTVLLMTGPVVALVLVTALASASS